MDTKMTAIETMLQNLVQEIIGFFPRIVSAIVFLIIAFIALKILDKSLNKYLIKELEKKALIQVGKILFKIIAYYTIILATIAILGLNELAASLGTAIGFLALGVSFALRSLISDVIAGLYLIRDTDIEPGDRIELEKEKGEVKEIGIKKTRFTTDEGNTLVLANTEVEKKWTKINKKNNLN